MTITAVTGFAVNSSLPRARISKQRKSSATEGNLYKRINNFNYCDSSGAENKTLVESFASEGALLLQQILTFSPTSATFFFHADEKPCSANSKIWSQTIFSCRGLLFFARMKSVLLCLRDFFTNEVKVWFIWEGKKLLRVQW
jgi:hypothetical protein